MVKDRSFSKEGPEGQSAEFLGLKLGASEVKAMKGGG